MQSGALRARSNQRIYILKSVVSTQNLRSLLRPNKPIPAHHPVLKTSPLLLIPAPICILILHPYLNPSIPSSQFNIKIKIGNGFAIR